MTRRFLLAAMGAVLVAAGAALVSCAPRMGWGLVLWSAPEGPLPAGSIVPVYIRSNIQKLYVVGVPSTSRKVELPLWQLELFPSKRKAAARLRELGPNVSLYMVAARDGLPLRDGPTNNAKRVFRLREGQTVKILAKTEGETVTTAGEALPGDWYEVLAGDGTRGFVFSFAMRLYDESKEGPPVLAAAKTVSGRVDLVFSRAWKPEFFQEMEDDGRVDLERFSLRYGLFSDAVRHQVRIELPGASQVFNYGAISEEGGVYVFEGTLLRIRLEGEKRLVATWTEDAAAAAPSEASPAKPAAAKPAVASPAAADAATAAEGPYGADGRAVFVVLTMDARAAVRAEELRRQRLLGDFIDRAGTEFGAVAGAGGRLSLSKSGRFTWAGRETLSEGFLPASGMDTGEPAFRLYLDAQLAGTWDGALSLRFDAAESGERPDWVDLLYRVAPEGLVLAPAAPGIQGMTVAAADSRFQPIVLAKTPR